MKNLVILNSKVKKDSNLNKIIGDLDKETCGKFVSLENLPKTGL